MDTYKFALIPYYFVAIIYLPYYVFQLSRTKKLNAITIVRGLYILIYSIVPIITLNYVSKNGVNLKTVTLALDYTGMEQLSDMCFFSFVGFIGLELGYSRKKLFQLRHREKSVHYEDNALWCASLLMAVVSFFALLLWTYPFGGPIAMFEYGTLIRSGRDIAGISNTFGFMKQFVPLAQFASIISLALYYKNKQIRYLSNFAFSLVVSLIYLIANDGRAAFLMYIVSLFLLHLELKKKDNVRKKSEIVSYFVIGIIGFWFISNIYSIIGAFTGNTVLEEDNDSNGLFGFLYDEFSWTVRNAQAVRTALSEGYTFKFFNEILSGILAWFPSRFRPTWFPRLEKVNTVYWYGSENVYGGKPPDMITAGLYTLSYPGVFILPFLWGYIIKHFDNFFEKRGNSVYYDILFVQMVYQFTKIVPYDDFAILTLNMFYIVLGHFIVIHFNRKYERA